MRTMYDAVDANDVPLTGWDLLAGYVNGHYPSAPALRSRFPRATVVEIDVLNHPGSAQVLDIERGDALPSEAPDWFDRSIAAGIIRPTLYYSSSDNSAIKHYMGGRHYDAWIASYDVSKCPVHSDPQVNVVAWQKIDHGPNGENVDVSDVFDPTWPKQGGVFMALSDAEQKQLLDNVNHNYNFNVTLDKTAKDLGYTSYADLIRQTVPHKP